MGPSRETRGTPAALCPTQPQYPLVLIARSCGDLSSRYWNPGLWILLQGWAPCPPERALSPRRPSCYPAATHGVGPACSMSPPLPPVSRWPPLYVLNCRTSAQLDPRQPQQGFCAVSCNLHVVVREGKQSSTYSAILTRNHVNYLIVGVVRVFHVYNLY